MKRIENVREIVGIAGLPLWLPPEGWEPTPEQPNPPRETASLSRVLNHMVLRMPMETMRDAEMGRRVVEALREADAEIELEDADYAWLMQRFEQAAPKTWGVNAALIKEAIGQPAQNRAERRRKK